MCFELLIKCRLERENEREREKERERKREIVFTVFSLKSLHINLKMVS